LSQARGRLAGMTSSTPVLWTRGQGCAELATALSPVEPVRVTGDLATACIAHRARLLVARRLTATELVACAIPIDFPAEPVGAVVAAVSGGPHSSLAAVVARDLGRHWQVPASMACAYRDPEEKSAAEDLVGRLSLASGVDGWIYEAAEVPALFEQLPDQALLVLGAPGGSWFQRLLFGQGARLRHHAPHGAVIVRSAPRRVFQVMTEPVFVGPLMALGEVFRLHEARVVAVVEGGRLIGQVRWRPSMDPNLKVGDVLEPAVAILQTDEVGGIDGIRADVDGSPVSVVDESGLLVGSLPV